MSTIASPPRPEITPREPGAAVSDFGDQRIVIRGVGRHVYDCLSEAINQRHHIRLAYDGKDLELMTTGYLHEHFKGLLSQFVATVMDVLEVDRITCGQATWKTEHADRGLEADLSYYFDPEKIRVASDALRRQSMEPADYPIGPDLAIEIDVSRPQVDRPSIYAALKAMEVWRFDGSDVRIEQLQPDGTYAEAQVSRFLPVSAEDVRRWLLDDDATRESVWQRRLRQWAQGLRPQE